MSDWQFNKNEVLLNEDEDWWHVVDRLESVDGPSRYYVLEDATHTERQQLHKDDVEGDLGMFESAGWDTNTKPASEHGFRVNGVLCGPSNVEFWKGNECVHEEECLSCGAAGYGEIDVIHDIENQEVVKTRYECRECDAEWVVQ